MPESSATAPQPVSSDQALVRPPRLTARRRSTDDASTYPRATWLSSPLATRCCTWRVETPSRSAASETPNIDMTDSFAYAKLSIKSSAIGFGRSAYHPYPTAPVGTGRLSGRHAGALNRLRRRRQHPRAALDDVRGWP